MKSKAKIIRELRDLEGIGLLEAKSIVTTNDILYDIKTATSFVQLRSAVVKLAKEALKERK